MDIEETLETVRKEDPEIYQVIIAFLKGEISREEKIFLYLCQMIKIGLNG
ncbi:hypothetical protein [Streptococcus suis]|nr:hypothetical protein [Streptococcus suis]